jgi:hypothetical protein
MSDPCILIVEEDLLVRTAEISPLRRRMIEDMTIRNMSPATQRSYISAVSKFSRYFGRSPDKLRSAAIASARPRALRI